MGAVGTAEGIGGLTAQLLLHLGEITLGEHHIGIQHDQVLALGTLGTIVPALAGTGVVLEKIM